jgi:hypothetical protein
VRGLQELIVMEVATKTSKTSTVASAEILTENFAKVDVSSIKNELWLVKIPQTLAKVWNDAPDGVTLGKLTFTKGSSSKGVSTVAGKGTSNGASKPLYSLASQKPSTSQSMVVTLSPELLPSNNEVPSEYSVEALTRKEMVPLMHAFTRYSAARVGASEEKQQHAGDNQPIHEEGTIAIHGTVTRSCSLQIKRNSQYREVCKTRIQDIATAKQYVKPVDVSELNMKKTIGRVAGGGATVGVAGFGESVQQHGKRLLEAAERVQAGLHAASSLDAKRLKFEGQPIRSVIFELFSHQPYWTAKELRHASGRVEKEIRPMLHELCNYIKNGEHKGMWELKNEFRMQPTSTSGASGTVDDSSR